jgi:hypothetical protein
MSATLRLPGEVITIGKIDSYGLTGRNPHPPADLNGQKGTVVSYTGWTDGEGHYQSVVDPYRAGPKHEDPAVVYAAAAQYPDAMHFYLVTFDGGDEQYEICEYEMEGQ